ncbi:MAG: YggS family pyridoxal phosphate-dependent enzyme [Deltaproteobacteria bacterium]|nr:YggS family pyridoxal phosphate-dependent enzyme [Deltaproteobacteria bacterium]
MPSVTENLNLIKDQISLVSKGRDIQIVAVTKHQPIEKVKEAINAGVTRLAVNYAQEGDELRLQIDSEEIEWHFIGHIQSRKIKYLTDYQCIHSLDRLEVAEDLNHRLEKLNKAIYVLVEVNIGREAQKSGILPERLEDFLDRVSALANLKILGLMVMPPMLHPVEDRRVYFKEMAQLYQKFKPQYHFEVLSMGTSDDYLLAIQEGSTMVRLGTCLFGRRSF